MTESDAADHNADAADLVDPPPAGLPMLLAGGVVLLLVGGTVMPSMGSGRTTRLKFEEHKAQAEREIAALERYQK